MKNVKFFIKGHAQSDLIQIRKYTIKNWGNEQWLEYKKVLYNKLQSLANNPNLGIVIHEISPHAFWFPLKDHVVYYLQRKNDIVFVGLVSNSMAPEKHLLRKQDISNELSY